MLHLISPWTIGMDYLQDIVASGDLDACKAWISAGKRWDTVIS